MSTRGSHRETCRATDAPSASNPKSCVESKFRTPHTIDATFRTLRADREINLHPLSVHAEFGTPPEYVVFCDFGLDADGASVARHVSRCDPRVLIAEAGEYYELRGGGV